MAYCIVCLKYLKSTFTFLYLPCPCVKHISPSFCLPSPYFLPLLVLLKHSSPEFIVRLYIPPCFCPDCICDSSTPARHPTQQAPDLQYHVSALRLQTSAVPIVYTTESVLCAQTPATSSQLPFCSLFYSRVRLTLCFAHVSLPRVLYFISFSSSRTLVSTRLIVVII